MSSLPRVRHATLRPSPLPCACVAATPPRTQVCRHHAAAVATGCGHQASLTFACPYHGWTYDDRGRLVKATRLGGIQGFRASAHGLHPIALDVWGDLVFLHLQGGGGTGQQRQQQQAPPLPGVAEWLGEASTSACARMPCVQRPVCSLAPWCNTHVGPCRLPDGAWDGGTNHLHRSPVLSLRQLSRARFSSPVLCCLLCRPPPLLAVHGVLCGHVVPRA